jgi:hypothetical protein
VGLFLSRLCWPVDNSHNNRTLPTGPKTRDKRRSWLELCADQNTNSLRAAQSWPEGAQPCEAQEATLSRVGNNSFTTKTDCCGGSDPSTESPANRIYSIVIGCCESGPGTELRKQTHRARSSKDSGEELRMCRPRWMLRDDGAS